MTLQIGDAVGNGIRRAATYSGGVLMALTFLYQLVFLGSTNTIVREFVPPEAQPSGDPALLFPVPPTVAGVLAVLALLFGMVMLIATTRAMVRDVEALSTLPSELFTRRIGRALLSAIGANIVVSVAVVVGFALLIVPGIFLALSFLFVVFAIAVEDERALDAMRRSWQLAGGNRWRLLALFLIVVVGSTVVSGLGSLFAFVAPIAGQLASMALSAVVSIVVYGVLADAYLQLRDDVDRSDDVGDEPTDDGAADRPTAA